MNNSNCIHSVVELNKSIKCYLATFKLYKKLEKQIKHNVTYRIRNKEIVIQEG